MSEFLNVQDRNVSLAPLDAAYVGAVKPSEFSKLFLRDSVLESNLPQPLSEANEDLSQGAPSNKKCQCAKPTIDATVGRCILYVYTLYGTYRKVISTQVGGDVVCESSRQRRRTVMANGGHPKTGSKSQGRKQPKGTKRAKTSQKR